MIRETFILFNRTLKHITRSADTIITTIMMPIAMMLLFIYVFGGSIKQSLGGVHYIDYLLPGILIMTIASGVSYVGYRLFEDRQKGMFTRVKSMPIKSSSFLWAHVLVSLVANLVSIVLVVVLGFVIGFRSSANFLQWIEIIGLLILLILSFTWLMIIPGLLAKNMTGASILAYPIMFLPMLSSGFVPTQGMASPVKWFANHQPMTAISNSLRNLFMGQPAGSELGSALIWMILILFVSLLFATLIYKKAN